MSKLKNKVAIITGGTGALGRGVVKKFLSEGAKVLTTYISDRECEECRNLLSEYKENIIFQSTNVTDEEDVLKALAIAKESLGEINILVNIVGGFLYKNLKDTSIEEFDGMIDMNLKSCFVCCQCISEFGKKNCF